METIRLAVVQQDGCPGQVLRNRDRALYFADLALTQKPDVILFHEELLVGNVDSARELAEELNGPSTRAFQNALRGTRSLIIYGLTERAGSDYYISAPVVSADGVLANYRKNHLWWNTDGPRFEPAMYKPGDGLVTFDVRGQKSGIMICYDGDFPEMARSYANLGCSTLFWLNNRSSRGREEVFPLAHRNSLIIATSCCCGLDEIGNVCSGGSNILDATGDLLAEIWDDEGVIYADVNPSRALELRERNPWYRGLRPEIYQY